MDYTDLKLALDCFSGKRNPEFSKQVTATSLPVYGLYAKDLKALSKRFSALDLSSFRLNESYEANLLYFDIALSHLETLEEQVGFLLEKADYIDTWAITDSTYQKMEVVPLAKARPLIQKLLHSKKPFAVRYGYLYLFHYKLEDPRLLFPLLKNHSHYYVKMAQAWLLAELSIYHPEEVIDYLEKSALDPWVKKKAIAKARESYRVSQLTKKRLAILRDAL